MKKAKAKQIILQTCAIITISVATALIFLLVMSPLKIHWNAPKIVVVGMITGMSYVVGFGILYSVWQEKKRKPATKQPDLSDTIIERYGDETLLIKGNKIIDHL